MVAPPIAASILVFFPLCLLYLSLALTFILLSFETNKPSLTSHNNVFHLHITSLCSSFVLLVHIRAHTHRWALVYACMHVCEYVHLSVCIYACTRAVWCFHFERRRKKMHILLQCSLLWCQLSYITPSSSSSSFLYYERISFFLSCLSVRKISTIHFTYINTYRTYAYINITH